MSGAALLVLLLLHHPVMSLMTPMMSMTGLPRHRLAAAAPSLMVVDDASIVDAVVGTGDTCCSICLVSCPLTDGITPSRIVLRSVDVHQAGHTLCLFATLLRSDPQAGGVPMALASRVGGRVRAQRTRRALLQVYLL